MVISGQTFGNVNISTKKKKTDSSWLVISHMICWGIVSRMEWISICHSCPKFTKEDVDSLYTNFYIIFFFLSTDSIQNPTASQRWAGYWAKWIILPLSLFKQFSKEFIFSTCFEILLKIGELMTVCQYNQLMEIFQCNFQIKMWIVLSSVNKMPTAIK